MSRRTEQKFNELASWWKENERYMRHPERGKRDEAIMTFLTNIAWILTYLVEDVQTLEGRRGRGGTGLYLPEQVKLDQDLRVGGDTR